MQIDINPDKNAADVFSTLVKQICCSKEVGFRTVAFAPSALDRPDVLEDETELRFIYNRASFWGLILTCNSEEADALARTESRFTMASKETVIKHYSLKTNVHCSRAAHNCSESLRRHLAALITIKRKKRRG